MSKKDYVVVCGDFGGVWNLLEESREKTYWLEWLGRKPFTMLFVPGNHENYVRLTGIKDGKLLDCWLSQFQQSPISDKHAFLIQMFRCNKQRNLKLYLLFLNSF